MNDTQQTCYCGMLIYRDDHGGWVHGHPGYAGPMPKHPPRPRRDGDPAPTIDGLPTWHLNQPTKPDGNETELPPTGIPPIGLPSIIGGLVVVATFLTALGIGIVSLLR